MKIRFITLCVFVVVTKHILAQQSPQYTYYMYNHRSINPAYMINEDDIIEVGGLHRTQWMGLDGGPKTVHIFASVPLQSNLEIGTSYIRDVIGSKIKIISDNFSADVAYKIKLSKKIDMSAGLKFGVDNVKLDPFNSTISNDLIFQDKTSKLMFNLGFGLYFFSDDFYFGFSIPNFINSKITDKRGFSVYKQASHKYATAGYICDLNQNIKLKPAFMVKQVNGAPPSLDISLNVLLYQKLELGIANRNQDALSTLISFYTTQNLKFGYAYDFGINKLRNFHSGSHEIFIIYRFDTLDLSKTYKSPRFY